MERISLRNAVATLTPKGFRVGELLNQGMHFDAAFAIADAEYTSDGLALKPGAHTSEITEVHA